MDGKTVTRDKVLKALIKSLEPLDYIHALWEGGAAAYKRIDEWSDMDIYIVVDDEKVKDTFLEVEKALKSLSPIKQKYDVPQTGWEGVYQAFYRLEGASEYLVIDLAVLKLSSPDMLLEPKVHGEAVFYLNKSGKVQIPAFDRESFDKRMNERSKKLQERIGMFNSFVQKEINRGNYLEAVDLYYRLTLATLVEVLRIKYSPIHYDFQMRYVHYELPPKMIDKLHKLYFVEDEKDLQEKYRKATSWIYEVIRESKR
ncbi:MAG: hypothetical protein ACFE7E_06685 [Candidatus Hodarchaeota archaeon]